MDVHTVQISQARNAYVRDIHVLDITVKSGLQCFAPTWDMVRGIKSGELSEQEYTSQYVRLMETSQAHHPDQWRGLFLHDRLALACYCKAEWFCHRHLLKSMIINYGHRLGEEVIDMGEVLTSSQSFE